MVDPAALGVNGFAEVECGEGANDDDRFDPAPAFRQELRDGVVILFVGVQNLLDRARDRVEWIGHGVGGTTISKSEPRTRRSSSCRSGMRSSGVIEIAQSMPLSATNMP